MTKKQSVWFMGLGILYSVLVTSLGGVLAYFLGWVSLIYTFYVLITNENNGYKD